VRARVRHAVRLAVLALAGAATACTPSPVARALPIRELAFPTVPHELHPGDTITWTNEDLVPHTVTAKDGRWDSGELAPGDSFVVVVDTGGTVPYVCRYHPTMSGTLDVR
jgi:plastocyanin